MRHCLSVLLLITAISGVLTAEEKDHFRRWADKEEARKFRLISDSVPSLEVLIPEPNIEDPKSISTSARKGYTINDKIDRLLPKMDRKFFSGIFSKNYSKAYEIALEEEHNILPMQLVSDEMRLQATPALWGGAVDLWEELLRLDDLFRKMDALDQQKILFNWREPFREKLQEYVSYRSSLKPWWTASLISNTTSDSNVNRDPDELNAPTSPSGRSGGQQTVVLSLNIKPLINYKKFPKDMKWDNTFTLVKQNQWTHQENDLATLGYEPKLTKTFTGPISKVSVAYKYNQLLLNPGSFESREVKSFAQSHRLKLDLSSKNYALDWGMIRSGKGDMSLSSEWKSPFDPGSTSMDGVEIKLKLTEGFKMSKGSYKGTFKVSLEMADFETEAKPDSDYDYWKLTLDNSFKYKWGFWNHPIEFKQKFDMRTKTWDLRAGGFEEDLYTLALRVGTKINAKLKSHLEAKQNWRETDQTAPAQQLSAKQTQITFNLTWKIQ